MFLSTCYTEISKKFQNLVDFGVIWLILRCFNGFGLIFKKESNIQKISICRVGWSGALINFFDASGTPVSILLMYHVVVRINEIDDNHQFY